MSKRNAVLEIEPRSTCKIVNDGRDNGNDLSFYRSVFYEQDKELTKD